MCHLYFFYSDAAPLVSCIEIRVGDIDFKVIGEVNNSDKIEITLSNGEVTEIENRGYNHYVS